jgi:hypothetical protein
MSTPAWILGVFAAVMLLVAEVSAGQLVIARAWTRRGIADADVAVSQLLIGISMAGMLVSDLSTLPSTAWEVIFAALTAWFAWRLRRESRGRGAAAVVRGHYAPHVVHSAAMVYMLAAPAAALSTAGSGTSTSSMSGMPGMGSGSPGLHAPTLGLFLVLLLIAVIVHDLDRRAGPDGYFQAVGGQVVPVGSALAAAATRLLLSPAVVKGCQVTTGVTMAFMLVIMI